MLKAFEKKLGQVRLRCSINLLIEHLGRVLIFAGIAAALAVLAERLLALSIMKTWTVWSFWAAVALLAVVLWLVNQPSRMQVSLLLDKRLRLHERFSTTLALAESQDPFACAAKAEARETARRINPQTHFPVRPSRCWVYVVSTWLVAVLLVLFMPQKDLLGFFRKREQKEEQARQVQEAKADVKETTKAVKSALKQLGDPELAEDLARLGQMPTAAKPEDIKRQAIRELGDLSDKLKQMQNDMQLDSLELMRQMFKQLPSSTDSMSQKLRQALAQGNFNQASNMLKQMQQQLLKGELSDEQRKALSQQLQELARQLQELAEKNKQLEDELQKQGLDKKLAKMMTEKELRQALQKQGLSPEKIEQLLQKAAACRMASSRCSGLGQAMAACGAGGGQLSGEELAEVAGQLDSLEALQQQLMLTQASLDEINRAMACLGQGMCQGSCQGAGCPRCGGRGCGGQGPFGKGPSGGRPGPGTGGPGQGYGERATDDSGATSTLGAKVPNQPKEGPVIASWYFKGTQERGEAKRDFSEVMQAARDSVAEAISENQIPRKYEEAVKSYFGQLEESRNE